MLKHLQLLVLILCGLVSLIGGGTDNPTAADNMDIDLDSVDLAPLLNSSAGQEFTANPWDVNMDNKINLLDLFLVNQNAENAMAPAVGPAVKGPLSKGAKLSNGFYELEVLEFFSGGNNYKTLRFDIKITNVGDNRGVASHISGANFKLVRGGFSLIPPNIRWLGSLGLGESTIYRFSATNNGAAGEKNQYIDITGLNMLVHPSIANKIIFQAYSSMVFHGSSGIPTGGKIGSPIVFGG